MEIVILNDTDSEQIDSLIKMPFADESLPRSEMFSSNSVLMYWPRVEHAFRRALGTEFSPALWRLRSIDLNYLTG